MIQLPAELAPTERLLTAQAFHRLADVPPEVEWFANLTNAHTRRAYENAVRDFMRFTGIVRPDEFRSVTRAHLIAWRDALVQRGLGGSTVRHRLTALASLFDYLCEKNAVTHNPAKGVKRPMAESGEGKTPAIGDHQARDYAKASSSDNTRRAYTSDWRQFATWCRRQRLAASPADPRTVGLYITALASGAATVSRKPASVATIERRLSALSWTYAQTGEVLDRADRHIATVLAGIRRTHGKPPVQKEAVLSDDVKAMIATLDLGDLRGLRDRAILLIGFAGGLRRSEIVGLDRGADQTQDGSGWIEILEKGLLLRIRGKTGWREVEIGRGSSDSSCPLVALETWLTFGRIAHGPVFRRVTEKGRGVSADRLNDKHVARLVKQAALAGGVRADLPESERKAKFAGHSLRAGLASSAEVDERHVQKQLGHATAEMTRRYQRRRDRFRVNLTKAAGL